MNKKINIALFISFFTGFNVLSGNVSLLPAFADDADESELVSFSCPSTALGFSRKYVDQCYRKGFKKMELQARRKRERERQKRERENAQSRNSTSQDPYRKNAQSRNSTSQDPYRKNADAAAMQRYLMNNQNGSYPFKRTDLTIESEKQIDRINHQMRMERGINESRKRQRNAAACMFRNSDCR